MLWTLSGVPREAFAKFPMPRNTGIFAPTFAGDRLWLATWVHENDFRLTMWRRYQILRESDRKTVLRGQTQWVCVDMKSGRPRRMPPEFQAYTPWPVRA